MDVEERQKKSNGYGLGLITGILVTALVVCGIWAGKIIINRGVTKEVSVTGLS